MDMQGKIRLLICNTCQSVEELPLYEGRPERDDTLNYRVSFHRYADGNEHFGGLATVSSTVWENQQARQEIVAKLRTEMFRPGEAEGLGSDYYNVKSTFGEDAFTCWQAHNRTTNCDDWRSDKKRLYPDTSAERKDLGLSVKDRPNTWLCDFCPVTSVYAQRRNEKRGDYK